MKKLIALLLALVMMFSLIACGTVDADPTNGKTEPPTVADSEKETENQVQIPETVVFTDEPEAQNALKSCSPSKSFAAFLRASKQGASSIRTA